MDYLTKQGAAALGSRLRRLLDRLDRDVAAIYRQADAGFEARWFPVFTVLRDEGSMSVGGLAERLGVTHAAVSQVRAALEAQGLIRAEPDPDDGRRQLLALSERGREMAVRLQPLWAAVAAAGAQLLAEAAPTLMADLDGLDRALDRSGLKARVDDRFNRNPSS
jgi:DNA-binding MarR family transcriptional regulator